MEIDDVIRRVSEAQPKIFLGDHQGYYRHADVSALVREIARLRSGTAGDLEAVRKELSLPEGGQWDYSIERGCWVYTRTEGPKTFAVTAGLVSPPALPIDQG